MLALYQREFAFKGVIFTNSAALSQLAKEKDILVVNNVTKNPYGLPLVNEMFLSVKRAISSKFYGYINSDILIHPRVFSLLPKIYDKIIKKKFSPSLELASRVRQIRRGFKEVDFHNITTCFQAFSKCPTCPMRTIWASVSLWLVYNS